MQISGSICPYVPCKCGMLTPSFLARELLVRLLQVKAYALPSMPGTPKGFVSQRSTKILEGGPKGPKDRASNTFDRFQDEFQFSQECMQPEKWRTGYVDVKEITKRQHSPLASWGQEEGRRIWVGKLSGDHPQLHYLELFIEGSLEVKLPTIWTDGKAEVGRVTEEAKKWEDQRREKVRRKRCRCAKR